MQLLRDLPSFSKNSSGIKPLMERPDFCSMNYYDDFYSLQFTTRSLQTIQSTFPPKAAEKSFFL